LCFGSLGFVYTRLAESVAGRTFAQPPRPNVLTGVNIGMLGPNPTQERFRLAAYYLTDLSF
jgi:hypothetical protein